MIGKLFKKIIHGLIILPLVLIITGFFAVSIVLELGFSNLGNRKQIGDIRTPSGFERVEVQQGSFGDFIRHFPLRKRGSKMLYYNGQNAFFQYFGYAVLDLPLISSQEYCADAVQRMRAEYLFSQGRTGELKFRTFDGKVLKFNGNASDRDAMEQYLCRVYDATNTGTIRNQLSPKNLNDIQPGDVLVYAAGGRHEYGHAVLVADVAVNKATGKKVVLLAQSSMPALTMHIVRNVSNPLLSPWVEVKPNTGVAVKGFITFSASDLRAW